MAFGGLGTLFTLSGGILTPFDLALAQTGDALPANAGRPLFVQISDTHIGFNKEANPDVSATLKQTIGSSTACRRRPRWPSIPATSRTCPSPRSSTTRRNCSARAGTAYGARRARRHRRFGRRIFRPVRQGVGQPRLLQLRSRGRALHRPRQRDALRRTAGSFGDDQLAWLAQDLKGRSSSTPIVVFSHMPMWTIYEPWGWGTGDAPQTMARCAASARSPY